VAEDYRRIFAARLKGVDAALQQPGANGFLAGGRFTAADVSVGYALQVAASLGLEIRAFSPAVSDYWTRLQAREAFQRAVAAEHCAALAQGVDPTPAPDLRPFPPVAV
jgi:glutathione S-transferase